jgi:hypothetical protein
MERSETMYCKVLMPFGAIRGRRQNDVTFLVIFWLMRPWGGRMSPVLRSTLSSLGVYPLLTNNRGNAC